MVRPNSTSKVMLPSLRSKHILKQLNGQCETKYFTAKVLNNSAFDKTAGRDQDAYHSALKAIYAPEDLDIIFGYHTVAPVIRREFDYWVPNKPHLGCEKIQVWHIEEKQTDVNVAIHSLRDAYTDPSEQLHIFVSNDSDLAPLVDMLSELPHIRTGIITPIRNEATKPSVSLVKNADWSTGAIKPELLKKAQLPYIVNKGESKIRKPIEWFGASRKAYEIFSVLFDGLKKRNAAYRWLEQQPIEANIAGLLNLTKPAIEMLDEKDDAELVLKHARQYISYVKKSVRNPQK